MEKAVAIARTVVLIFGALTMIHRIITAPKDTEVQRLQKDVSAIMFLVIYLVIDSLAK
jgi:uncharacterized ion transporter superfamily protein YfcC